MMHNEVKYDVKHTHDIFTKEIGGSYIGTAIFAADVSRTSILDNWGKISGLMTAEDMYIQYSSGHGNTTGLMVGVKYDEIRDQVLAYPGKELIVFTMACNSGGLVDSFNRKKTVWQDWQTKGRTLMVFASSKTSQSSSTGPGTDPDEPNGPNGSAGSAFGHALWKALIGYADGFEGGAKDGFLSLGEIEKFTLWKTQKIGGHTPVSTGVYNSNLIMNKVPPKAWVESLEGVSEGLSDEEILQRIRALDEELRVNG
jgi:hypothetical protein